VARRPIMPALGYVEAEVKKAGRVSWPAEEGLERATKEVPGDTSDAFFHGLDLIHQPRAIRGTSEFSSQRPCVCSCSIDGDPA
jgi:hypothetical protein